MWEFTTTGTVHPHLIALCAVWLRSPQPELGDRSATDWVTDGHPVDRALELAAADAQRWAE